MNKAIVCCLVILSACATPSPNATPGDVETALRLGLTVEVVRTLHRERGLSNRDMLRMPTAKLERDLYRTQVPKPDNPGEWARWRRLSELDQNGKIPDNALLLAKAEMDALMMDSFAPVAGIQAGAWDELGPGEIGGGGCA